ncbi:MAG TPA: DUF2330 domain-containing protein, partial [Thermoanaerobaculia bacterium]
LFTEYAWDMNWCDPCAADPLSRKELRNLGVFWVSDDANTGGAAEVFLTRLHVRYDRDHFPEDLVFQETGDRQNFQARYVLHHPWTGSSDCDAARSYKKSLRERQEREATNLARLTGWKVNDVRKKMNLVLRETEKKWWQTIWQ